MIFSVAADVVAAENDKIGISNFDASANDIYRLFALAYRYLSVLLIVHLRVDLVDISQMQNAEFSVRAEAQGSPLFFYIFLDGYTSFPRMPCFGITIHTISLVSTITGSRSQSSALTASFKWALSWKCVNQKQYGILFVS